MRRYKPTRAEVQAALELYKPLVKLHPSVMLYYWLYDLVRNGPNAKPINCLTALSIADGALNYGNRARRA